MVETDEPSEGINANPPKLNKSGIPKGALGSGYIKGRSCGKGRHEFVVAKTGKYAVCVKCHHVVSLDYGKWRRGPEDQKVLGGE